MNKKQTKKNNQLAHAAIDLCRTVVVPKIVELFRGGYQQLEEEDGCEGEMCAEAQIVEMRPKPKRLCPETDREKQIYEQGQADAYLGIIEEAVRISPDRDSAEIKEIRSSLLQVMPREYRDRINRISSAKQYTINNNYKMEYNKYNNCNIAQIVEKGGNGTVHVHMDGKKNKTIAKQFNMSEQQLAAIQRALDNGCITDNGDGTYLSNMEDSSLAYLCGRIFCGDYCVAEAGKLVWKKGTTNFPNAYLSSLFGKRDLGNSRSTRLGKAVPKDYQLIDELVD